MSIQFFHTRFVDVPYSAAEQPAGRGCDVPPVEEIWYAR